MSASFASMCKQAVANLFDNPCWGNLLPSNVWWVVSVGVASSLHRRPLENYSYFWHRLSQASMDAGHYGFTQICLSKPWSQIWASQSATVKKNSCNWCRMAQGVYPLRAYWVFEPLRGRPALLPMFHIHCLQNGKFALKHLCGSKKNKG